MRGAGHMQHRQNKQRTKKDRSPVGKTPAQQAMHRPAFGQAKGCGHCSGSSDDRIGQLRASQAPPCSSRLCRKRVRCPM